MTASLLRIGVMFAGCACACSLLAQGAPAATNLLSNGDFEKPIAWGRDWSTQQKQFLSIVGDANHGAKCLHMTVPHEQAVREGVAAVSEFVPCQAGGTYRIQFDCKGTGPTLIVFVEAYDPKYIDHPQGDYRKQCDRQATTPQWKTVENFFRIRNARHSTGKISKMQVKLFTYGSSGQVWVDNVILEPASPDKVEQVEDSIP